MPTPVCVQIAIVRRLLDERNKTELALPLLFEPDHRLWCHLMTCACCTLTLAPVAAAWTSYATSYATNNGRWSIVRSDKATHLLDALESCPRFTLRSVHGSVGTTCTLSGARSPSSSPPIPWLLGKQAADAALQDALSSPCGDHHRRFLDVRVHMEQTGFLHDPDARARDLAAVVRSLVFRWAQDALPPGAEMSPFDDAGPMMCLTAADALMFGISMETVTLLAAGVVECVKMDGSRLALPWHFAITVPKAAAA
jgi:hypothetical protein